MRLTTKLLLTCAMAANLALPADLSHADAFTMQHRFHRCRFASVDGRPGFTNWETRTLIACAVDHWNVPGGLGTVLAIVDRESGFYCKAQNPSSSARGLLQIVDGTWASWYATFSPSLRRWGWHVGFDRSQCRASIIVGVRAMHRYGLGAWS